MEKSVFKIMILALLSGAFIACGNDDDSEIVKQEPQVAEVAETVSDEPGSPGSEEEPSTLEVNMVPGAHPIELNEHQKSLVARNNDFSFNLFREVYARYGRKSVSCSPLSVSYVLGMMNDGAQGQTSDEIVGLLGYGHGNKATIDDFCRSMMEELPLADPSATVRVANSVFVDKAILLEENFRQQVLTNYQAQVSTIDFSQPEALTDINRWCSEQTDGVIPSFFDKLNPTAMLMILNATYFKATWAERFEPEAAKRGNFTNSEGSVSRQFMLHWHGDIWYSTNDIYSTINLPYGSGDNWSMMVLLPNEGKSLGDVINSLSEETWNSNWKNRHLDVVDVKMPKFSTQSDLTLNDILSDMGAKTMFNPELADFSLMTKNLKKTDGHSLYVDYVKQKTSFAVTEEGTELATVTEAEFAHGMPATGKLSEFHADRPFVYLIREASTGAIFFIGTFQGE